MQKHTIGALFTVLVLALAGCATEEARSVRTGDIEGIRSYLRSGGDVNARQRQGETLLMIAAEYSQYESAVFLLDNGARVGLRDDRGRTALMYAAGSGSGPVVELLLQSGAPVNEQDNDGTTALMYGASDGNRSVLDLLISAGADVRIEDRNGRTALYAAVRENNPGSLELLVRAGAEVNRRDNAGNYPIVFALESDHIRVLETLLAYGADATIRLARNRTLLMAAAENNNGPGVQVLLEAAPHLLNERDDNNWNATLIALRLSAENRSRLTESARVLLEAGGLVEYRGQVATQVVHSAARTGNVAVLNAMLSQGMGVRLGARGDGILNDAGEPLVIAALPQTEFLLELGRGRANMNVTNGRGETALVIASRDGNGDAVTVLLQLRADPDLADSTGKTPLMYAAGARFEEIVRQLLIAGAETRTRDESGNTALHYAAATGNPNTVRLLITAGADVSVQNREGFSPVDIAANNPFSTEIIDILVAAGATPPAGE